MNKLPSSFTSLYRLFLRAGSASVLHQKAARKQLRWLFRPIFDVAARVVGDLQSNQLSRSERVRRELFLDIFQQRMDGTLSLLLNSAQYRGVPHRAIYNLNRLRNAHAVWTHRKYYSGAKNAWNPKVAVAHNLKPHAPQRPRDTDRMEKDRMHERCWDAFGEVVRMAEGRHNLSLGRLHLKPWTLEKR
ncbi:hypothetical protein HD554DRAFT_687120 [Boletus coccyginus]|nr:hypothetical protein HD554DRAFT_687120 [Boletus coccyginus]